MVSAFVTGSEKLAYNNKCCLILPFITKFVACLEQSERKKCNYFAHRICVLQIALQCSQCDKCGAV